MLSIEVLPYAGMDSVEATPYEATPWGVASFGEPFPYTETDRAEIP